MAHTWSPHLSALHARPLSYWWQHTTHAIESRVHTAFASRDDRPRKPPRHHPTRYAFLETACMAREMDRL